MNIPTVIDMVALIVSIAAGSVIIPWAIFVTKSLFLQKTEIELLKQQVDLIRTEIELIKELKDYIRTLR